MKPKVLCSPHREYLLLSWGEGRSLSSSFSLLLIAVVLTTISFPPWNLGIVTGWICLCPLIASVWYASLLKASIAGWVFGFLSNFGIFFWLLAVPGFHWYHFVLLSAYLSLYPAVWAAFVSRLARGPCEAHIQLAYIWVLLDYARNHAGFLALPMMTAGQTQVDNIYLMQQASILGESFITFIVVLGNLAVWNAIRGAHKQACWLGVPILSILLGGALSHSMAPNEEQPVITVASVRTNFHHTRVGEPSLPMRMRALVEFLDRNIPQNISIVALPESSFQNISLYPEPAISLKKVVNNRHWSVVIGVSDSDKFGRRSFNSAKSEILLKSEAWIYAPGEETQLRYQKSKLIPFVEEAPFIGSIHWPQWLVPPLPRVERGPEPHALAIPNGPLVGVLICWESLFSDLTRATVTDGANLLFVLANEGWFGHAEAGEQHKLTARMRAAEANRSLVLSSNNGPSSIIDPSGRIVAEAKSEIGMSVTMAAVPLISKKSLYTRLGDVFIVICLTFFLFSISRYLIGSVKGSGCKA